MQKRLEAPCKIWEVKGNSEGLGKNSCEKRQVIFYEQLFVAMGIPRENVGYLGVLSTVLVSSLCCDLLALLFILYRRS